MLNSLEELDWGESFTTAMRKDMKKQLKGESSQTYLIRSSV